MEKGENREVNKYSITRIEQKREELCKRIAVADEIEGSIKPNANILAYGMIRKEKNTLIEMLNFINEIKGHIETEQTLG